MLLNVALGVSASSEAVLLSHWAAFIVTIVLQTVSVGYLYRKESQGPLYLQVFASPLILANPVVNLLLDNKAFQDSRELSLLLNAVTVLGTAEMVFASLWDTGWLRYFRGRCARDRRATAPTCPGPAHVVVHGGDRNGEIGAEAMRVITDRTLERLSGDTDS